MDDDQLIELQRKNLEFTENWLVGEVHGIDVVKAMSYFLVQFLNKVILQEMQSE